MKITWVTWAIVGFFVLAYFFTPVIYRQMKKSEYEKLYNGMQDAKIAGGSYHDEDRHFASYADKLIYGDNVKSKPVGAVSRKN